MGKANQVLDTLKAVKDKVAVIKGVEWARTPHSFSHILLAVTQQVITAIYGLKYYLQMPSLALKKKGFSIQLRVTPSWMKFSLVVDPEEPMVLFKRFPWT